ncbi:MAG TPA: hypothetical protein PLB07_07185 [Bacteroidales bacterium]|nr:hypothetical protein [Bacteroidales bacterium]
MDFGIILLLSGFKKFFYRIFKGLFSKLLYSNFEIGKKLWEKTILLYDPYKLLDKCLTTPYTGGYDGRFVLYNKKMATYLMESNKNKKLR